MLFQQAAVLPTNYPALSLDAGEKVGVVFVVGIIRYFCRAVGNWAGLLVDGESEEAAVTC
jgi:hypothetical protein